MKFQLFPACLFSSWMHFMGASIFLHIPLICAHHSNANLLKLKVSGFEQGGSSIEPAVKWLEIESVWRRGCRWINYFCWILVSEVFYIGPKWLSIFLNITQTTTNNNWIAVQGGLVAWNVNRRKHKMVWVHRLGTFIINFWIRGSESNH